MTGPSEVVSHLFGSMYCKVVGHRTETVGYYYDIATWAAEFLHDGDYLKEERGITFIHMREESCVRCGYYDYIPAPRSESIGIETTDTDQ